MMRQYHSAEETTAPGARNTIRTRPAHVLDFNDLPNRFVLSVTTKRFVRGVNDPSSKPIDMVFETRLKSVTSEA